jgi:hypothetical protein
MTPFHGLVLFQLHPAGGWRVFDTCPIDGTVRPLPLSRISVNHAPGHLLLGVCGTFRRRLRRGTWCKRPHEEIIHA